MTDETEEKGVMSNSVGSPHVGVLCVAAVDSLDLPGAIRHAGSLPLLPDAECVLEAEDRAGSRTPTPQAYRIAADKLVDRGAAFVTTDCAWNIEVAEHIKAGCGDVPSLSSILCLLPLLVDVFPVVGVVSIRAWRLRQVMAATKVAADADAVRIEGVSEDGPWRTLGTESQAESAILEDELVQCGSRLVRDQGSSALLLDCTTFAPFANAVQGRCGVPTFGLGGLIHYLMGSGIR